MIDSKVRQSVTEKKLPHFFKGAGRKYGEKAI